MPEDFIVIEDFSPGFLHKKDVTQVPAGSLIVGSENIGITDGDRIGPRKGTSIVGTASGSTTGGTSLHTARKPNGTQVMMRAWGTVLEYYHDDTGWENLNSGYTDGQTFGFADHNVNDDIHPYTYFCNAVEPYSRWVATYDRLDGALSGGETEISIQGLIFTSDVFYSGTASSTSTTTIDIADSDWATNEWDSFYVRITSGGSEGKVSKISATTNTQITFSAISGLSGTPTFEIRQLRFDESNQTLRIGTTDVTYTGYQDESTFSGCSNAPVASDGDALAQGIEELFANGVVRGNILIVQNTRMFVSGVKESPSSIYYSAIADAADFSFSVPRSAEEGGVIDTPEGGGPVTGLGIQEDVIYILKEDLIKTLTFSQDANDLPSILPLVQSPDVGPINNQGVFKVDNVLMYASADGGVKQVTRTEVADFAEPKQLSDSIVKFVDGLDFSNAASVFYDRRGYIACKRSDSSFNDVVLVFNFEKKAWEAPIYGWNAADWAIYNGELHFISSTTHDVYKTEQDYDDDGKPYRSKARLGYINFGAPAIPKQYDIMYVEGFISENTNLNILVRYNYQGEEETKETSISGTDSDYIVASGENNILGNTELGVNPLGITVDDDEAPSDLQRFRVYFTTTPTPFYEISVEFFTEETGAQWEILRYGFNTRLLPHVVTKLKKQLA